jgi:hypothetical protein
VAQQEVGTLGLVVDPDQRQALLALTILAAAAAARRLHLLVAPEEEVALAW